MLDRLRRLLRSTTTRFVLLAFLFQLPVTVGVLIFAQRQSQAALAAEQREWVAELRADMLAAHVRGGRAGLASTIATRLESVRGDLAVILLTARDGTPIAGNLGAWPSVVPDQTDWRTIDLYRTGSDRPEHIGVSTRMLPDGTRLLTGRVIDAGVRLAAVDDEAMIAAFLLSMALTLLSALVLSRILSRQIQGVVQTASAIGDGDFAERVPVDGSGDAFDTLGRAINAMLDRIHDLVTELRLITDGLAHDLKSPVTRLKSVLEHARLETSDPEALAALEKVSREAELLLTMLSTALLISRTQAGVGRERMVDTDVQRLLHDLVEVYGPLAEDHGFTLVASAEPGLRAPLHRELISQALGNLIENALKYADGGGRITLSARRIENGLALAVADDGPGIPRDRRQEALKRFGRLDPARTSSGSGLGLTLVEAVARLHDGQLALADGDPGLRVVLSLRPDNVARSPAGRGEAGAAATG